MILWAFDRADRVAEGVRAIAVALARRFVRRQMLALSPYFLSWRGMDNPPEADDVGPLSRPPSQTPGRTSSTGALN